MRVKNNGSKYEYNWNFKANTEIFTIIQKLNQNSTYASGAEDRVFKNGYEIGNAHECAFSRYPMKDNKGLSHSPFYPE